MKEHYIYIIQSGDLYKIGRSTSSNLNKRMANYRSHNPDSRVVGIFPVWKGPPVERQLHLRYKEKRITGEWFRLSSDELEEIQKTLTPPAPKYVQLPIEYAPKQNAKDLVKNTFLGGFN